MPEWIPKPYQEDALKFILTNPHDGLILDMGLGKTAVSLAAIKMLIASGHIKKVLLVAPIRTLYSVWPAEIKKWTNLHGLTYHNWHASRLPLKAIPNVHIVGINPESALTYMKREKLHEYGFDLLLIDEAHMYKNPASQRFKALKKILHHFPYRWILTGTPAANGLVDIWALIYILDLGAALGKYITHFRNDFCVVDRSGFGYEVMPQYKELLYQRISHLLYRLPAKGNIDMPELILNEVAVTLPKKAMDTYKAMERDFIALLESGETVASPNAAVAGMRCRQIANGGLYLPEGGAEMIHMAKAEALKEVVEGLQGSPLLIFYEFVHDVERIEAVLGKVPNLTKTKNVDKLISEFNAGKHPVMLGHPATVGVGLNLQEACHNVLWMGPPWDLMAHDQANARVYRQGQPSDKVVVHYLMAEKTLDAAVLKALAGKARVQEDLFRAIQNNSSPA